MGPEILQPSIQEIQDQPLYSPTLPQLFALNQFYIGRASYNQHAIKGRYIHTQTDYIPIEYEQVHTVKTKATQLFKM